MASRTPTGGGGQDTERLGAIGAAGGQQGKWGTPQVPLTHVGVGKRTLSFAEDARGKKTYLQKNRTVTLSVS